MDTLVSELNEELVKARPKRRSKEASAELGKQLEERLSSLQRDSRVCKKPKSATRILNREYIYSGCSIQPKRSTQTKAKVSSSKVNITAESAAGMISVICSVELHNCNYHS